MLTSLYDSKSLELISNNSIILDNKFSNEYPIYKHYIIAKLLEILENISEENVKIEFDGSTTISQRVVKTETLDLEKKIDDIEVEIDDFILSDKYIVSMPPKKSYKVKVKLNKILKSEPPKIDSNDNLSLEENY